MSLDSLSRKISKEVMPRLKIQGPRLSRSIKNGKKIKDLFERLDRIAKDGKIVIDFEPDIMKKNPDLFFKKISAKSKISCKQLAQYRFDAKGKRIVCEFIRNEFNKVTVSRLEKSLLPICRGCCKLQQVS